MNDDAQQTLLAALAERYGADPFSARDAAAAIPGTLWQGVGVDRPDASSCGRWLRAHRSATLTGKPDRSGVVRWQLKAATGSVAALQAPARPGRARASATVAPAGAPAQPCASSTPCADRRPTPARAGGPAAAPAAGLVALVAPSRHDGREWPAGSALGMRNMVGA